MKDLKAILTIIGGTIGVGFLAIPYSIYTFGTVGGILVLVLAGVLTLVTNITFSEIITYDKGNRQIPGYAKKYLGDNYGHVISVITILGSFGVLLAYSLISGKALGQILSLLSINLSPSFLGLLFILIALFIMRRGMKIISEVSSYSVLILIAAMMIILIVTLPNFNTANVTGISFGEFGLVFGISIFAMFSAASVPLIDELIGYDKKRYKRAVTIATLIILAIYIVFGLVLSLTIGDRLTSSLIDSLGREFRGASIILSVLTLLATFTSFVIIANNMKEIFHYDYKLTKRISNLIITTVLIWSLATGFSSFESLISKVGTLSLALQSIGIYVIWLRINKGNSILLKIIVIVSGLILLAGMLT